ncbi:MAG TPA: hypothetical protein VFV66_18700 [Nonomuraea sp.]|nr:hypothetical protein [Nonomuraea sp.]
MSSDESRQNTKRKIAVSVLSLGAIAAGVTASEGTAAADALTSPAAHQQLDEIRAQFDSAFTPAVSGAGDGAGLDGILDGGTLASEDPGSIFAAGDPGSIFGSGDPGSIFAAGDPGSIFGSGDPGSIFAAGDPGSIFGSGGSVSS